MMRNPFEDQGQTQTTNIWDVALEHAKRDLEYLLKISSDDYIQMELKRSPTMGKLNAKGNIEYKIEALEDHLRKSVVLGVLGDQIAQAIEVAKNQIIQFEL